MAVIAFLGTSQFACRALDGLERARRLPALVITRRDSSGGRKGRPQVPPVKKWAVKRGLPLWQPANINSEESLARLRSLGPHLLVVVAYGRLLGPPVLSLPSLGAINVHASLLPDLRGAAPVERAIMLGFSETGVTTMYMDAGLDTGDIILQEKTAIGPEETGGELMERLAGLGQELLLETIELILQGKAPRRPQPPLCPNYAPPLSPADERLDWTQPAEILANQVRALAPEPGCYCIFRGKRLKVYRGEAFPGQAAPGELVLEGKRVLVGTGRGRLALVSLKAEGKKLTTAEDFANGYRLRPGELFL